MVDSANSDDADLLALVRSGRKRALEQQLAGALAEAKIRRAVADRTMVPSVTAPERHRMDPCSPESPSAPDGFFATPDVAEAHEPPPFLPADFTFVSDEELRQEEEAAHSSAQAVQAYPAAKYVSIGLNGRPTFAVRCITREMQMQIVSSMLMDGPDHVRRICAYPQRTPEWFAARVHRLTGSKAGTAAKMNPYETQDQLLAELLWPTFVGNGACLNGTLMEPFAAKSLLRLEQQKDPGAQLAIPGLIVSAKEPIFAYSADGIVLYSDGSRKLIEIKTPVRRKPYASVPPMYMCQMQLGMYLLGLDSCMFVVYCGRGVEGLDIDTHVTEIPRDDVFIEQLLLPRIRNFFFTRYLPLRVCFEQGMLRKGQVYIPHGVSVDYLDPDMFAGRCQ